jgi:hypothetical protein
MDRAEVLPVTVTFKNDLPIPNIYKVWINSGEKLVLVFVHLSLLIR